MPSSKISLKYSIFIISLTGILFFLILHTSTEHSRPLPVLSDIQVNSELPIRLEIPRVNIDTNIESTGFAPDGSMDVPKKPDDAAWFSLGPYPGEIGSAVIDGHSGWKDNRPAVFDNLSELQKGDKIYVENKGGAINTFIVREVSDYNPNQDTSSIFSSSDGKAHLNLITCTGAWNEAAQTHSKRLIVFSDKE